MTTPSYCTAAEIKAVMPDTTWDSTYDVLFGTLADRASREIDGFCRRLPGEFAVAADATRYFDGSGCIRQWIDDMAAAPTSVAVDENWTGVYTTWAATDYILWPYNGPPYNALDVSKMATGSKAAWYAYPRSVKIVGKFGYSTSVPSDIKQAAIVQAVRWFKRGQAGFADVGGVIELGRLIYLKALDPEVVEMLKPYRRAV